MLASKGTWTKRRGPLLALKAAVSVGLASGCNSVDRRPSAPEAPTVVWQTPLSVDVGWRTSLSDENGRPHVDTAASEWQPIVPAAAQTVVGTEQKPAAADPSAPAAESESMIDLATALQLAGTDNPTINLSREAVEEAVARYQAAQVLLLPNLTAGANYHQHRGVLQTSGGIIENVNSQDAFFGAGALAVGAQTVAYPGVRLFSHLGDAIYEPLAARQNLESRRSLAAATENDMLLAVAGAYFDLLGAEVRLEALHKSEAEVADVVRLTESYARAKQGRAGDAHRAEGNAALVHRQTQQVEGERAAASARLAGLLNLDPAVRLRTPGGAIQPVQLIDENEKLENLIQRGRTNRPEIKARLDELAEAQTRARQERIRPFLPTLSVGFSAGGFGGGSNRTAAGITTASGQLQVSPSFGNFDTRTDFDVFAVWTLQNAGAGNRALTHRAQAVVGEAVAALDQTSNEIRRQIAAGLADVQTAARQIEITRAQLALAEEGFREEMERIKKSVGRPLETLDSFRQLSDAQQDILRAVVVYNAAQYRLFVAIGMSPLLNAGGIPARRD